VTVEPDAVVRAVADIAAGRPVVVVDDREEGAMVFAAAAATPALLAFTVRHTAGCICVALPAEDCDRLGLPPMCSPTGPAGQNPPSRTYTVTVDARQGVSTGISARDRARTIRLLADPDAAPADLVRPGHVLPLRAAPGGVLTRRGHPEAALDLARLAGLAPAGALCEVVSVRDPGAMARRAELVEFAAAHDLELITVDDLVAHRRWSEQHVVRAAESRLRTAHGTFRAIGYTCALDGTEHVALVLGTVDAGHAVRVERHVECLAGDVFASQQCGCRQRLEAALAAVAAEGRGVVIYLRGPSAIGAGLPHGCGRATSGGEGIGDVVAAQILRDLGVRSARRLDGPTAVAG
jgi:3,4-dihydroxy 2-butanone 4-phosphate synthase/GTP cyclohydrolase II